MRDFDSYAKRNTAKSIKQGGNMMNHDVCNSASRLSDYNDFQPSQMSRLDKNCLKFEGYDNRSFSKSIYNRGQDQESNPTYDSTKVINGVKKTTKGTGKSHQVNMKKQVGRDHEKLLAQTVGEQYKNIQRANEAEDYMKKLLMQE